MTTTIDIDEAIKILHKDSIMRERLSFFDLAKAERLGIEALKLTKWIREGHIPAPDFRLPGETK